MAAFFRSSESSVTLEVGVYQDFAKHEPKDAPVETAHKPSRYLETHETVTFFFLLPDLIWIYLLPRIAASLCGSSEFWTSLCSSGDSEHLPEAHSGNTDS